MGIVEAGGVLMSLPLKIQTYIDRAISKAFAKRKIGSHSIPSTAIRGTVAPSAHDITAHTATGGSEGDVPTVQADGSIALQAQSGGPHNLMSTSHPDTDPETPPVEGAVPTYRTDKYVPEAGVGIDSDAAMIPALNAVEQGSTPTTPGAGHRKLYAKTDGWYDVDDTGTETPIGAGGGVTDHGALTGLADDDHEQYLTEARHAAIDHTGLPGVGAGTGGRWEPLMDGAGGFVLTNGGDIIMCGHAI
jgi:hypothetical protein